MAGASGLAGSSVVRAILATSPTSVVQAGFRSRSGCFLEHDRLTYVQGDLRNPDDCARLVKGCDAAVLTAANSGGAQQAASEPWHQVTDNVVMDSNLMQALHFADVRRVVYVSSATVYPEFEGYIREDQLDWNQDPQAAYFGVGWAKRYVEKLCRFWHEKTGMHILIARSSNIFGPFAKFDPRTANFIPALIHKAVDKMEPFEVWGDPQVTRDVIYSDDFGAAIVAMLNATEEVVFDTFNVGSGRRTTVGEVVDLVLRHSGHRPSQVVWRQDGPTTIAFRALDCSKIRDVIGWTPAVSVDEGIRRTVRWWEANAGTWVR
ncbi:MAG: NAD-dependent epimerase/dehydratase family protein [Alphaproteobacteria bacterium]|nr:NAD-dependent epimerase/dehydratase family protein [Alphaproteobacteria bacterium]